MPLKPVKCQIDYKPICLIILHSDHTHKYKNQYVGFQFLGASRPAALPLNLSLWYSRLPTPCSDPYLISKDANVQAYFLAYYSCVITVVFEPHKLQSGPEKNTKFNAPSFCNHLQNHAVFIKFSQKNTVYQASQNLYPLKRS